MPRGWNKKQPVKSHGCGGEPPSSCLLCPTRSVLTVFCSLYPLRIFLVEWSKEEGKIFTLIIVHDLCSWSCVSPRSDVFCYVSQKWPIVFLFSFCYFRRCSITIASAFRDCLDRRRSYNVILTRFIQPLLQWKSNKCYILWVCICSHRYPSCNAVAPYCHMSPARLYNIFPYYPIKDTIFEKR